MTATARDLFAEIAVRAAAAPVPYTLDGMSGILISASTGNDVFINQSVVGAALTGVGIKITAGTNLFLPYSGEPSIVVGGTGRSLSYECASAVDVMLFFD